MQMWNWEFRKSLGNHIYSKKETLEDAARMIAECIRQNTEYHLLFQEVDYEWHSAKITLSSENGFDSRTLKNAVQNGLYTFLTTYRDQIIEEIGEDAKGSLECALSSITHVGLLFDLIAYPGENKDEKIISINL